MSGVFYDAAAGSGKTTYLAKLAAAHSEGHVLLTTFTDENTDEIGRVFLREEGRIPENVDIVPWYTFVLRECVRPFQGALGIGDKEISGVKLVSNASALKTRTDDLHHYVSNQPNGCLLIYSDKVSEFALRIDAVTGGLVLDRLSRLYSMICIDEVQDMSGYDLELIAALLDKVDDVRLAGDLRQATYRTSNVRKNSKYLTMGFGQFLQDKHLDCHIDSEVLRICHRCPQAIVDLADALYPALPPTVSSTEILTDKLHVGVFLVGESDAVEYSERYGTVCLVYNRTTKVPSGIQTQNMGAVKGRTFDRVLLFPTSKMRDWLFDHSVDLQPSTRSRLYVAITRARLSVAIVVPDPLVDNTSREFRAWNR